MMGNKLTYAAIVLALGVLLAVVATVLIIRRRRPKFDTVFFESEWKALQANLRDKSTWPVAVIEADKLLDTVLKSRKYKGKTMGERLVSAQHDIKNNDEVWFGHKLRNKVVHEHIKLNKGDVKAALLGIRRALKDLGAL